MQNNSLISSSWTEKKWVQWTRFSLFLLLSFSLPVLLGVLVLKQNGFYPFDSNGITIISIDFQSQYISYLRYYRKLLIENGSLIYTTSKTFGGDFLSIFTYYLASPFNLLLPFIAEKDIPFFMLRTDCFKRGFASAFFYLLCRFKFQKNHLAYIGLSIGYGRRSYFFVYSSNFRWLDALRWLPLVILGYEFVKEGKHLYLYPLAVFRTRMAGWYLGAMVCLFLLLLFLADFFSRPKESKKDKIPFLYRFGILSIIGGLLAGILWIPAFLHFSGTKANRNRPSLSFLNPFAFLEGFRENGYSNPSSIKINYGYRSRFVGRVPLVLAQLYFFDTGYSLKKRLAYLILFLVYALGSRTRTTNALLHGGREPTWFPCRYSFLFGFLVCYFAAYQFSSEEKTHLYGFIEPLIPLSIVVSVLSGGQDPRKNGTTLSIPSLVIYCIALALCFGVELIRKYKPKRMKMAIPVLSLSLAPLAGLSSYRGADSVVKTNVNSGEYQLQETYEEDIAYQKDVDAIKNYAKEEDPYRRERTFNRPGNYNEIDNNPRFYSYAGLSHFSSSEKKSVEDYRIKLGFQYNYYSERLDGGSTLGRTSLLGLKYFIDEPDSSNTNLPLYPSNTNNKIRKQLSLKGSNKKISFYQNTKALPLGYTIGHQSSYYIGEGSYNADSSIYWFDQFEYQNEIFKEFVPSIAERNDSDIYKEIPFSKEYGKATLSEQNKDGYFYLNGKKGDSITFSFWVPEAAYGKNLYRGEKQENGNLKWYLDGKYREINTYWHKGIRGFKDNRTHKHTLTVVLKEDRDNVKIRPGVYYEDDVLLSEYLDELRSSKTELKEIKGNNFYGYKGTFYKYGNKDFLFTLPYERGVSIKVDGKKCDLLQRWNIFSGVDLTSLEDGKHTIEIRYTDTGFVVGKIFSILALVSLGAILFFSPRFMYGKGENPESVFERRKKKYGQRK